MLKAETLLKYKSISKNIASCHNFVQLIEEHCSGKLAQNRLSEYRNQFWQTHPKKRTISHDLITICQWRGGFVIRNIIDRTELDKRLRLLGIHRSSTPPLFRGGTNAYLTITIDNKISRSSIKQILTITLSSTQNNFNGAQHVSFIGF